MQKRKPQKTSSTATHVTTTSTGTNVRIEEPQSHSRRKQHERISVIVSPNQFVGGFIGFVREHAIVGLAIGFVIGTQVQAVVKQLVASFIGPLFQLFFGQNLALKTSVLEFHGRTVSILWGAFVYGLLNFLFVLIAIYAVIKIFSLDKLDKTPEPPAPKK